MSVLYTISIYFYILLIRIAALFNTKAGQWVSGRKHLFEKIASAVRPGDKTIWIHSASLGEFEQGRPVIEALKKMHPEHKILLTFFSPSGNTCRLGPSFRACTNGSRRSPILHGVRISCH
jgi:3-deoxy-D-manno-octulosonic-acid transferase